MKRILLTMMITLLTAVMMLGAFSVTAFAEDGALKIGGHCGEERCRPWDFNRGAKESRRFACAVYVACFIAWLW